MQYIKFKVRNFKRIQDRKTISPECLFRLISFVTISSWDVIVGYRVISVLPRIYCKVPPPVIHQLYY